MQEHRDPALLVSPSAKTSIRLQPFSRHVVDMRNPDALREAFRLACLASGYFGGNLVVVNNWLPALTLRVALGAGVWLCDLPNPLGAVRALDEIASSFDACWHEVEHGIQSWLSSPRQPAIHHVCVLGQTTVCWTDRVIRVERPVLTLDAGWAGLPSPRP
ncbi:MAG: hypothetical protein EKK45_01235 [Curvibacter sp.]|jgi:hypothetical protein|nr:MAG: hypothetical protein EKK45_01235 [Curvibacter sp.]